MSVLVCLNQRKPAKNGRVLNKWFLRCCQRCYMQRYMQRYMRCYLLACLLFFPVAAFTSQPPSHVSTHTPTDAPASLNQAMVGIGATMVDIYPLIVAKRPLTDEETRTVSHALTRLTTLFHFAKPFIKKKSDTYTTSYQLILEYLEKTSRAFQSQNINYGRSRLYALGSICTSCHTQDTKLRTLFSGTERARFSDDYSFAEFNYITRNYDEAIRYFDKYLLSGERKTELEIVQPIQRMITIYAQIYNRPGDGAKKLSRYLKLKHHTQLTKEHLEAWIDGLDSLERMGAGQIRDIDFRTLKSYVIKSFGPLDEPVVDIIPQPREEISLVWLRGQLYHYLNKNPEKDQVPKILYWLAISDRAIGYNFYFALADLYLKQCVLDFPAHPYAKLCFAEYKEYIAYSYSGSAGTFIPPKIVQELEELQAVLKKQK